VPAARVLVVGSVNVDVAVATTRLPRPGETVADGTLLVGHGGKGANQAVAARRLGADVRLVACVGDDAPGRALREALAREGIDVAGVSVAADLATGTAVIVVDAEGRNQIAVAPGANGALSVDRVRARRDDFGWADILVCQLETPMATVAWALEEARARGVTTILNPAPVPDRLVDVWRLVDYLTPNAAEAERLSGVAVADRLGAAAAARVLRERGAGAVIVTLGEEGALAYGDAESPDHVAAMPVTPVDTTAAGDAFNGALALGLAEGRTLGEAVRFANAAAAVTCTRRGAQPSLPWREEVERVARAHT
jgi:ribokinase